MWIKLIGSIFVVLATSFCGFTMAKKSIERPHQLRQLISVLETLKSYINYVAMPLPEAFLCSAKGIDGPLADFCKSVGVTLQACGWITPEEAIKTSISNLGSKIAFAQADKEILQVLGANLGKSSKEEQYAYLSLIQEQLRNFEREAIQKRDQNVKMYRYLGIFSGLAIVIVLV